MQAEQINVVDLLRTVYDIFRGTQTVDTSTIRAFFAQVWLWITVIGYGISILGFFAVIYVTMRLFELRRREEEYYSTLLVTKDSVGGANPRWQHIQTLREGATASEWREAITEADILLEDALTNRGYQGDGVGEKLKSLDTSDLATLNDAWEAHKTRNQIAHQGSSFALSEALAHRTLQRYESVFRELKAI